MRGFISHYMVDPLCETQIKWKCVLFSSNGPTSIMCCPLLLYSFYGLCRRLTSQIHDFFFLALILPLNTIVEQVVFSFLIVVAILSWACSQLDHRTIPLESHTCSSVCKKHKTLRHICLYPLLAACLPLDN